MAKKKKEKKRSNNAKKISRKGKRVKKETTKISVMKFTYSLGSKRMNEGHFDKKR